MKKSSTMLSGTETTVLKVVTAKTFPPSPYFSDIHPLDGLWIFLEYWLVPDSQSPSRFAVKFRLVAFNCQDMTMEEFEWGYIAPDAVLGRHIALGPPTSLPVCIGNTRDWSFTCTTKLPPGDIKLIPFDSERYHTSPGLDDGDLERLKAEIQSDPDLHSHGDDSDADEEPEEDEPSQKLPPDKVVKKKADKPAETPKPSEASKLEKSTEEVKVETKAKPKRTVFMFGLTKTTTT